MVLMAAGCNKEAKDNVRHPSLPRPPLLLDVPAVVSKIFVYKIPSIMPPESWAPPKPAIASGLEA